MDCTFTDLSYRDTGYFTGILNAYVENDERLKPFIKYPVSIAGMMAAIEERKKIPVDRELLVSELSEQYKGLDIAGKVAANIGLLSRSNTFTICTAHQPAIFTGNLFFIYKIVHVIKLAESLHEQFPQFNFVPVFFMGSEDGDLDELGNIFMSGEKIIWETPQRGAIGRMNTKGLEKIISRIEGELLVNSHGRELVDLLKECYLGSPDIQTATLKLVHRLFGDYGLVVMIPDRANFKKPMIAAYEDELLHQTSSAIVSRTVKELARSFKVQAQPRNINLFYLNDGIRERIEKKGEEWRVVGTNIVFDRKGVIEELHAHPERFSPNVILRGILQESILPDVAFIGGGGELAYWMELKDLFEHYGVSYPMLIVRNSFLVIEKKWKEKMTRLDLSVPEIFKDGQLLMNQVVKRESDKQLSLAKEIGEMEDRYRHIRLLAEETDPTLGPHVEALRARAVKPIEVLEKKMMKAEKRKFEDVSRQLAAIQTVLFPNKSLQERVDNFMPFYSKWGDDFIGMIYRNSYTLEQRFAVLSEK